MTTKRHIVLLAALLVPGVAHAQGGTSAPKATPPATSGVKEEQEAEAQAAMERGIAAFQAGDAETALEEYRRAMDLAPEANLPYRYAGEAFESLSRMPEAVESFETYLKKNPYVRDAASVQARIRRLRARYIDAALSVTCQPEGADVYLDDGADKVGITPVVNLPVHAGEHHVVVRREGYKPIDARLRFVAGASLELPCVLQSATSAPTAPAPPPPAHAEPEQPSHARRTWGYVALGAGATLLVGSAIVDATWLNSTIEDFHAAAASGDGTALGLERRAHALQTTLVVTYVTGGVLAATGVGLVLWDLKSEDTTRAKATPAPAAARLSTDGQRIYFTGRF